MPLKINANRSFQGSIVLGKGFVLLQEEAKALLIKNSRNKDVLFPYLNGDDLNNSPNQEPSRWVINFFDWPEEKARTYPDCFDIIERLVKPERITQKDKGGKEKWWQFLRPRKELYATISELDQVMVLNRYTKHLVFNFQSKSTVFSDSIIALALTSYCHFALLSSSIHEIWARKNSSTIGMGLRYTPSSSFETFPFLNEKSDELSKKGIHLYELRKTIMQKKMCGLTELYNQYNSRAFTTFDIIELRKVHQEIDNLLVELYGWNDISLKHNFYELENLSEGDRTRFTIHPDARKEILKRLLELNHQVYNDEMNKIPKNKTKVLQKSDEKTNDNSPKLF